MEVEEIKLAVTFESPQNDVDMYYGLSSLLGACSATAIVADTMLTGGVPKRKTHKSKVRNRLKQSAKGSFIQHFTLQIKDKSAMKTFRKIGKSTFSEVMTYFFYEGLFLEVPKLSKEAEAVIESLEKVEEELKDTLKEPLKQLHDASKKYHYKTVLSYTKPGGWKTIAKLDDSTVKNLTDVHEEPALETFFVRVSRFNTYTLNGRLVIKDAEETVAFSLHELPRKKELAQSRLITENLHNNNNGGVDDEYQYLKITAKKLVLPTGAVVKYLITDVIRT